MERLGIALARFIALTTLVAGCGATSPDAKHGAASDHRAVPAVATPPAATTDPEPAQADAAPAASPPPVFPVVDPAADAAAASRSLVLDLMPETCDQARFYMSGDQILGSELHSPMDTIAPGLLALSFENMKPPPPPPGPAASWGATMSFFRAAGALQHAFDAVQLGLSAREIAVCAQHDDRSNLVVLAIDMTGWGKPVETLARALRSKSGKPPLRRVVDGVTYLGAGDERRWIAVLGDDRLVVAATVEAASAAVARASVHHVDDGFARAGGHELWFDNAKLELAVRAADGRHAARIKTVEEDEVAARATATRLGRAETFAFARRMPMLAGLAPDLERATVEAEGREVRIAFSIAPAAMTDFAREVVKTRAEDVLMSLLKASKSGP